MSRLFARDDIVEDQELACDGGLHAWEDRSENGFDWKECRFCGVNMSDAIECKHEWHEVGESDKAYLGDPKCKLTRCSKCYLRRLEPLPCEHRWESLFEEDGGGKGFAAYIGRRCRYCKEVRPEGGRYVGAS